MEGGEEAHGHLDHSQGMGKDKRLALEAGEPVALPSVVLLGLIGVVFADVVVADGQGAVIGLVVVRAIKLDLPALQAVEETVEGGAITIPQFPVKELSCIRTKSLAYPDLGGLFLESATFRRVRRPQAPCPWGRVWARFSRKKP